MKNEHTSLFPPGYGDCIESAHVDFISFFLFSILEQISCPGKMG